MTSALALLDKTEMRRGGASSSDVVAVPRQNSIGSDRAAFSVM
jgi:hypothetical protein